MPSPHALPQIRVSDFDLFKPVTRASTVASSAADWDAGVKVLGDNIPGYRYSATFLTSLRSNLHLSVSSPMSPSSSLPSTPTTPAFAQNPAFSHQPPSSFTVNRSRQNHSPLIKSTPRISKPASTALPPQPDASHSHPDLPHLTYNLAPSQPSNDRLSALKLVVDSVAQQRQTASRAIILHPAIISSYILFFAIGLRYLQYTTLMSSGAGIIIIGLLATQILTSGYAVFAEETSRTWLGGSHSSSSTSSNPASQTPSHALNTTTGNGCKSDEPIILMARKGPADEIIGTLIFRYVKRERKAYIRAWTVKKCYRGKGVGEGLLEEALRVTWGRGGRGAVFEESHANSKRLTYPSFLSPFHFDAVFDDSEGRARQRLAEFVIVQKREKGSR